MPFVGDWTVVSSLPMNAICRPSGDHTPAELEMSGPMSFVDGDTPSLATIQRSERPSQATTVE